MRCWSVLAPDVVLVSDGGGVAKAPVRPIAGEDKVGRFMIGATTKGAAGTTIGLEMFNGQLGLVARLDGRAVVALAFRIADRQIQTMHLVANPEKLAALDAPTALD